MKNTIEKVKVEITNHDGSVITFSGDTAIVFTVDKAVDFLKDKAEMVEANTAFSGRDIPEPIFAETIGSLLAHFIKQRSKENPMTAAYELHRIADILETHEGRIKKGVSQENKEKALGEAVENLIECILN